MTSPWSSKNWLPGGRTAKARKGGEWQAPGVADAGAPDFLIGVERLHGPCLADVAVRHRARRRDPIHEPGGDIAGTVDPEDAELFANSLVVCWWPHRVISRRFQVITIRKDAKTEERQGHN